MQGRLRGTAWGQQQTWWEGVSKAKGHRRRWRGPRGREPRARVGAKNRSRDAGRALGRGRGRRRGLEAPPPPRPPTCLLPAARTPAFAFRPRRPRQRRAERRSEGPRARQPGTAGPTALPPPRARMAPAALWAALTVGLQLWAAGGAVPAQVELPPYIPKPGSSCLLKEYFNQRTQMCCSKCPPGYHAQVLCNETSNTMCARCEDSTYTKLWNWVHECLSCGSRCTTDQVETQACTPEQNRICACRPGWYCTFRRQEGCRLCAPQRKCLPGFGVAKPGTATSDVVCAPCGPGTFSDTTSSTDTCRPHRTCGSVAIPGNATTDAICASVPPTPRVAPRPASTSQPASTQPQKIEPTPGPRTVPSTSLLFPMGPSPPAEGLSTGDVSLPIGLIVGVTALGLVIIGLVNCVIMTQKKKKPFCLQGEAKVPHLPADKARGAPGPEQQHLLTTAPSSSSSSLESSGSAADRRVPTGTRLPALGTEKAPGSGEARASSSHSEPSSGSHGTQVNVTCIVNVCSGSDHGSQCASQASYPTGDVDASPSGSPNDEQVPFSKEECPFQSQPGAPETLLENPEEKPLPLGVPDAGMKPS